MEEKLLQCPYDPAHLIIPHRMAKHIVKCKKNYPDMKMKICPFNATHHVPIQDYNAHVHVCEDKADLERSMYFKSKEPSSVSALVTKPQIVAVNLQAGDEDWESDTDITTGGYNPLQNCLKKPIPRHPPSSMSKATKKKWRDVEVERVRRLLAEENIDDLVFPEGCPEGGVSLATVLRERSTEHPSGSLIDPSAGPLQRAVSLASLQSKPEDEDRGPSVMIAGDRNYADSVDAESIHSQFSLYSLRQRPAAHNAVGSPCQNFASSLTSKRSVSPFKEGNASATTSRGRGRGKSSLVQEVLKAKSSTNESTNNPSLLSLFTSKLALQNSSVISVAEDASSKDEDEQ